MSAFFVGQRIRKVRGPNGVGTTGCVVGVGVHDAAVERGYSMRVLCDKAWRGASGRMWPKSHVAACNPDDWEPIIPDGHRPAEISVEELLPFLKERVAG